MRTAVLSSLDTHPQTLRLHVHLASQTLVGRLRLNSRGSQIDLLDFYFLFPIFYFLPAPLMAITKMQSPISFKMAVTSQLCFTHSRLSHRCSSESNSRSLAYLFVDNSPSRHLSPSTTLLLLAEQVLPHKVQRSSAPLIPLLLSYSFLVVSSLLSRVGSARSVIYIVVRNH